MEALKDELTCPICMDLFDEPRRLPCGHVYCRVCLQDTLTKKYLNSRASDRVLSCPECRQRYDLTFQSSGVDIFPRDFKLMRLVELCKREGGVRSSAASDDDDGDDDVEQTAVKTIRTPSDHEASPPPPSSATATPPPVSQSEASSSTASQSQIRAELSREQLEAGLVSFGTPASSLSDDSWIYVQGREFHRQRHQGELRLHPVPAVLGSRVHERGDDSWLLPSSDGRFPVDGGADVRGSVFSAEYLDYQGAGNPASLNSNANFSGRYDNIGREQFRRYPSNEAAVNVPTHRPLPQQQVLPHDDESESSSESESESDERGGEGRSGDDYVDGSGSDVDSQGRKQRRSRLSRFFRSLVMSDSDSWDEDDDQGAQPVSGRGAGVRPPHDLHRPPHFQGHRFEGPARLEPSLHLEQYHGRHPVARHHHLSQGREIAAMSSQGHRVDVMSSPGVTGQGHVELPVAVLGPEAVHFERGAILHRPGGEGHAPRSTEGQTLSSEGHAPRSSEGQGQASDVTSQERGEGVSVSVDKRCDSNHNAVVEIDLGQGGSAILAAADADDDGDDSAPASSGSDTVVPPPPPPRTSSTFSSSQPLPQLPSSSSWQVDVSDDSGDEYHSQTSMLHPRRKPRSRLKKFFTSLLSLSSSEDDDDEDGQVTTSSVTSAAAASVSQQ